MASHNEDAICVASEIAEMSIMRLKGNTSCCAFVPSTSLFMFVLRFGFFFLNFLVVSCSAHFSSHQPSLAFYLSGKNRFSVGNHDADSVIRYSCKQSLILIKSQMKTNGQSFTIALQWAKC